MTDTPKGALAAAALRWVAAGGEAPPELAVLRPADQMVLYQESLACNPSRAAELLAKFPATEEAQ